MEPQEKLTTQQFIIDRLHDIQRKAEANHFADALASMKEVKAADVKNIYLIAIEKQIAKMTDPSLSAENRAEIVKSLPAMIERAISDAQRRASMPKAEEAQKGQKEAALEKLKSQYFQRADDYVEKGDYQRALEEIRRIYIIEPGSVVAKEYEQKIEQLATLHARGETPAAQPGEIEGKTAEPSVSERPGETEEGESGAEPGKSKLYIVGAAAVVVLAVGAWLIFSPGSGGKQGTESASQQTPPTQETAPSLPTATTSTPQTSTETRALTESPKPAETTRRPAVEQKPAVTEPKPAPARSSRTTTTSPARTQVQPVQQNPQPQVSQPAVTTPPPQPVQQPAQAPAKAENTPAPMPFVAIESPPECIKREAPQYPDIAEKMRIEGKVVVEVTVDAQGKAIQAKVVRSSSDVFDEAAVEAAMKSTYKPAMMSTGPVTAKVLVPFTFKIAR